MRAEVRPARPRRRPRRARHMADIQLYDATLRDGMQGEGLSLTAEEKLRVAHALDGLGLAPHRGRLPVVEPQGDRALRAARAGVARDRPDRAVRDDPAPRRRRPTPTRRCACSPTASRRSARSSARRRALHLEKVVRVGRDENLRMIERVDRPSSSRRASASSTTPSTSSTAGATTPTTRCAACARPPTRGAERVVLCDTNGGSLPAADPRGDRRSRARRRCPPSASASTATTTAASASPTRSPPSRPARRTCRAR